MVTSPGLPCAEIAADNCWRKFPKGPTETRNKNSVYSNGKRGKFTISL